MPVIGVASSQWTLEQLRARAKASVEEHGGIDDQAAFDRLMDLLHYIDGDYQDGATFKALAKELGGAQRPRTTSRFPEPVPRRGRRPRQSGRPTTRSG